MPPKASRSREWMFRLILVGVSFLVVASVLEIAARILRSRQAGGKEGREDTIYKEYDPALGWRKRKNANATYRRREYTVEVRINSEGLRDPERPVDPAPGTFRVLALGDSFMEGYTVDLNQTLTQKLEARLNATGCRTEVVNGGTAGYSTDQEYLFYRTDGARYRPALVLLFFFWNDVIYSDRQDYFGTPKPVFEMGGGTLRLHRYPVKEKPVDSPPPTEADDAPDAPFGSVFLGMLRERLWMGAPDAHDALARLGLWNPIPKANPRLEMLVYERRDLAPVEDAWEKVDAIVKALKEDVEAHGSHLAIVHIPGRQEIQDSSWRATKKLYRLTDDAWDLDKVRHKLQKLGAAIDVPVIDLVPPLRAAESAFTPTYFSFDGHWNARGHEVAAGAVFDWMKTSGSLPTQCGGRIQEQASSARVWDPATDSIH
jgi:lysophospholipase L1-like esterase